MFRRLQRYLCKCSWEQLNDAAVIMYIHFTGFNGAILSKVGLDDVGGLFQP